MTDENAPTSSEKPPKRTRGNSLHLVHGSSPRTPTPRRFALTSLRAVRRELARTYWQARDGELELTDASKLSFILASLGKIIESADLEARVRELENLEGLK